MFYVSLVATTKQKATVGTQNMKSRESKHMENHQFTKEDSKKGRKEKGNFKTTRKPLIRWY